MNCSTDYNSLLWDGVQNYPLPEWYPMSPEPPPPLPTSNFFQTLPSETIDSAPQKLSEKKITKGAPEIQSSEKTSQCSKRHLFWTNQEDEKLKEGVEKYGLNAWQHCRRTPIETKADPNAKFSATSTQHLGTPTMVGPPHQFNTWLDEGNKLDIGPTPKSVAFESLQNNLSSDIVLPVQISSSKSISSDIGPRQSSGKHRQRRKVTLWKEEEVKQLKNALEKQVRNDYKNWNKISEELKDRTPRQCYDKWLALLKSEKNPGGSNPRARKRKFRCLHRTHSLALTRS